VEGVAFLDGQVTGVCRRASGKGRRLRRRPFSSS
jgi:hypothetical protein